MRSEYEDEDRVWALVPEWGATAVVGPFDTRAEAAAYDPTDDCLMAQEMTWFEFREKRNASCAPGREFDV